MNSHERLNLKPKLSSQNQTVAKTTRFGWFFSSVIKIKCGVKMDIDSAIEHARGCLFNLKKGCPQRSVIYYAQHGISEVVLLKRIEDIASSMGITCKHNEIFMDVDFNFDDVTDTLVELGETARRFNRVICIIVDEIEKLPTDRISSLSIALHRCNQLKLPVMAYAAGHPQILKIVGKACPYAEWLFYFKCLDELN